MNAISEYLARTGKTQSEFAAQLGVTQGAIYHYVSGRRPVSEKMCVRMETITNGELTRPMLRPDDWAEIWPELIEEKEGA